MANKKKADTTSTTLKIKEAAHKLFVKKGFASTTIREIAEEAGTNVALLNYHFGSKQHLFELVIQEKLHSFFAQLAPILSDETTTLEEKIQGLVNSYIDFLCNDPDLVTFILNEIRKENFTFIPVNKVDELIVKSYFMQQLKAACGNLDPKQLFLSIIAMTVFPFAAKPLVIQIGLVEKEGFHDMMQERKKQIPLLLKSMLNQNG